MALHSMYMEDGDGFALVFSLTSLESVNELQSIREQIHRIKEGRVSFLRSQMSSCANISSSASAACSDWKQVRPRAGAAGPAGGRDQHLKSLGRRAILRDVSQKGDQHRARLRGPRAANDPGRCRRAANEGQKGAQVLDPLASLSPSHLVLHISSALFPILSSIRYWFVYIFRSPGYSVPFVPRTISHRPLKIP